MAYPCTERSASYQARARLEVPNQSVQTCRRGRVTCSLWGLPQSVPTHEMPFVVCQCVMLASTSFVIDELTTKIAPSTLTTTCRNYLLISKAWKQRTKIRMGRLPFSHVRMNYFWWAKTERIVVYSAVNLLFRNNKIQLSKCHYITIFMNCKISLTYISETHWKQSIKFQIESMFHFPFS